MSKTHVAAPSERAQAPVAAKPAAAPQSSWSTDTQEWPSYDRRDPRASQRTSSFGRPSLSRPFANPAAAWHREWSPAPPTSKPFPTQLMPSFADVGIEQRTASPLPTMVIQRQSEPAASERATAVPIGDGSSSEQPGVQRLASIVHRAFRTMGIDRPRQTLDPARVFAYGARGVPARLPYKAEMEQRFGTDFSMVQAHLGQSPAMTALGANAAANGETVIFRDSHPDKKTVAHELTHVVQYRRGIRSTVPQNRTSISNPSDPAEREAERVAEDVVAGHSARAVEQSGSAILRQEDPDAEHPENPVLAQMMPPNLLEELSARSNISPESLSKSDIEALGKNVLQRLGREQVEALGGVANIALPVPEDVPQDDVDAAADHNMIFRQVAETAATMWWLTLVDGPLPIGDMVYGALIITAAVTAAAAADHVRRKCSAQLERCLDNPWQPEWNRDDFGDRKDCGACHRECILAGGAWPSYKCPDA